MTLDFTKRRKTVKKPPMTRWQRRSLIGLFTLAAFVVYSLTATTVVLNGTTSLPHNGYLMVTWPKVIRRGSFIAFDAPPEFAAAFDNMVFVKEVVGVAGDQVETSDAGVCVNDTCRRPQLNMQAGGYGPLEPHVIPTGKVVAFGEAPNSLDSRYAAIGDIDISRILAVGYPIPIPHWKELGTWLGTF